MRAVHLWLAAVVVAVAVILLWPTHPDGILAFVAYGLPLPRPQQIAVWWTLEDVCNVLLFVPVGYLLTLVTRRAWIGVLGAALLSAAGETAQLFLPGRVSSIADVLVNSIGGALGALLAWIWMALRSSGRASRSAVAAQGS